MKIVMFGLGSIGHRHARILKDHFDCKLYAYRRKKGEGNDLGVEEIDSDQELQALNADIACICNPTSFHMDTAIKCAKLNMHLFIEKPLSHSLSKIDELTSLCHKKHLTCYTAYNLRFHPVIGKIKVLLQKRKLYHARIVCSSYLPDWRADQDHKLSYSSSKELGGGVVFDLSHELDFTQYLFGSIKEMEGHYLRRADITLDSEDCVDILLRCDDNLPVNMHLNFLSHLKERTIKVDFENGYIVGDLMNNEVRFYCDGELQQFSFDENMHDVYRNQWQYFFDHMNKPKGMNQIDESKELLEKMVKFKVEAHAG